VNAPSQRRALGALFLLIAVFFAGIATTAFEAARDEPTLWVVVAAAAALGLWMGSLALRALARKRPPNEPRPSPGPSEKVIRQR
jgi:hypothetical protein